MCLNRCTKTARYSAGCFIFFSQCKLIVLLPLTFTHLHALIHLLTHSLTHYIHIHYLWSRLCEIVVWSVKTKKKNEILDEDEVRGKRKRPQNTKPREAFFSRFRCRYRWISKLLFMPCTCKNIRRCLYCDTDKRARARTHTHCVGISTFLHIIHRVNV